MAGRRGDLGRLLAARGQRLPIDVCRPGEATVGGLAAYGLEAQPTTRIRDLADGSGYEPSEVVDILWGLEPGTTD